MLGSPALGLGLRGPPREASASPARSAMRMSAGLAASSSPGWPASSLSRLAAWSSSKSEATGLQLSSGSLDFFPASSPSSRLPLGHVLLRLHRGLLPQHGLEATVSGVSLWLILPGTGVAICTRGSQAKTTPLQGRLLSSHCRHAAPGGLPPAPPGKPGQVLGPAGCCRGAGWSLPLQG